MTTKEKNLKKGAKAFTLLQQIQKYANACFEQGTPEYEAVMHSISILEKNFEPYSIQFKKIRDEKQQKELVAKETCAREGHTGEWHEHEYTVWAICGDRGFERYCPITKKNWTKPSRSNRKSSGSSDENSFNSYRTIYLVVNAFY